MGSDECFFCKGYREAPKLDETEYFTIYLDEFPVSPGHITVFPKEHIESITDLDGKLWKNLQDALNRAIELSKDVDKRDRYEKMLEINDYERSSELIREVLNSDNFRSKPDGFNIGINEGEAAGRTIDNLHIHVIPRYREDVENPRGGLRGIIPGKKDYSTE